MKHAGEHRSFLCDDAALEISHVEGSGGNAVIAFTGVGLGLGGIQIHEFSKSLSDITDDIYYVKDKTRHWYADVSERIVELLNRHLASRKTANTTCLGNSMGGFGAIYFAPLLHGCIRSIAFSPQSSINATIVPWESRWKDWRADMPEDQGLDAVGSLDPDIFYHVFVGMRNRRDISHIKRMLVAAPATFAVIGLSNSGHGAAKHLKTLGKLVPLVHALLAGRTYDAVSVLAGTSYEVLNADRIAQCPCPRRLVRP